MIETARSIVIDTGIDQTWDYVRDIRRWSNLFPGCENCEVIDENDSRWVIKVGAGGLVRTVHVHVHIDRWDGPARVDFSFQLAAEPVTGGGSYSAVARGGHATEITLAVRVEGSGPLAPMWEAMSTPLLPQLAKTFAARLQAELESSGEQPTPAPRRSLLAALLDRLRRLLRSLFGAESP